MFYILYVLFIVALSFHSNFLDFFYRKGVIPNDTFGRIFVKWGKIFSPAILLKLLVFEILKGKTTIISGTAFFKLNETK